MHRVKKSAFRCAMHKQCSVCLEFSFHRTSGASHTTSIQIVYILYVLFIYHDIISILNENKPHKIYMEQYGQRTRCIPRVTSITINVYPSFPLNTLFRLTTSFARKKKQNKQSIISLSSLLPSLSLLFFVCDHMCYMLTTISLHNS